MKLREVGQAAGNTHYFLVRLGVTAGQLGRQ